MEPQTTEQVIEELNTETDNDQLLQKAIKAIKTGVNIDEQRVLGMLHEHKITDDAINAAFDAYTNGDAKPTQSERTNVTNSHDVDQKNGLNGDDINNVELDINANQNKQCFEWSDVRVTIQGKQILHGISGRVESGQLLAILGGSGAGKTTLLNSISGRLLSKTPSRLINAVCCSEKRKDKGTQVAGSVAYKGSKFGLGNNDNIKYISAYVMQQDIMCATATALEALRFSSKLRSKKSDEEQEAIIAKTLESLKLDVCKDTRIGNDAIRGMSGGEKKRTSVGVELVNEPELVFLDEPTSGLDSFTALKTLQILKGLTQKEGKQVIATLHQPSSEIFGMIDTLVLLAKGHICYHGPATDVVEYFTQIGYPCPTFTNIADFVVNRVQENSDFFIDEWKKHESQYLNLSFDGYDPLNISTKQVTTFASQFSPLLKREFQILARDPRPSKIRLVQTILFSLAVGLLYWNLPYTAEGLRDRFGAIFFLAVNSSMTGLISTIIVFPEQRLLFERERDGNMYYTTTWLFCKFLVSIPEQAIFTLIYVLICYWMVGFDSAFYALYISVFICVICTGSFGMIIGCFARNAGEAMQLMPMAFIPFLLFSNFLVSLDQIPAFLRWIQWLNPFKYMIDALTITELDGQMFPGYNGNAFLDQIDAGYMHKPFLNDFVTSYQDSVYCDWILLVLLLMAFRVITWIILVRRSGW